MKNFEKYKDELFDNMILCDVNDLFENTLHKCDGKCEACQKHVFDWLFEESHDPYLDEKEKEYLSYVIKPFRKRINYICKGSYNNSECIVIVYDNINTFRLPFFRRGTMYKGLVINKHYYLRELGL